MDKPLTLKMEELQNEITQKINEANIPAYCIKTMLRELYEEVDSIDKEEIQRYNEYIKNKPNKKESDK
jgi:hypothetical protein